jgi:CHAD domain-containing protein
MRPAPLTKYLTYQLYHAIQLALKLSKESDIEHLHQFRVAIRRSRSLLRLYLPEYYALQEILRGIVKQTNILRELDVFIASVDTAAYPDVVRILHEYRNEQFDLYLTDAFLARSIAALHKLYDTLCDINPDIATEVLIETAESHTAESLQSYNDLPPKASDKVLHQLRIRFKISRYAMEFLHHSALHEERETIRTCKKIQDHLGEVQDAFNQLKLLKHFYRTHRSKECKKLLKERKAQLAELRKLTVSNQ